MDRDQLTFLSAEPPASPSALQDSERDWMTHAVTSCSSFWQLLNDYAPRGWYGRTSPECCRPGGGGILEPFSGRWANSGMGGPTECLMLNTLEWPSAAAVCSLSDILETGDVPPRYFLSAKACRGILRRSERRGKTLPGQLQAALLAVAEDQSKAMEPQTC